MEKIRLLIELEYDDQIMYGDDEAAKAQFFCDTLGADPSDSEECLILHSNYHGDDVGRVRVISTMPYRPLTAELIEVVKKDPLCMVDDKDEMNKRLGWLICALDAIIRREEEECN